MSLNCTFLWKTSTCRAFVTFSGLMIYNTHPQILWFIMTPLKSWMLRQVVGLHQLKIPLRYIRCCNLKKVHFCYGMIVQFDYERIHKIQRLVLNFTQLMFPYERTRLTELFDTNIHLYERFGLTQLTFSCQRLPK